MNVTIIGSGRLGSALARRSAGNRHSTRLLYRTTAPTQGTIPSTICIERIHDAHVANDDLIIIAAPGTANAEAEAAISTFLKGVRSTVLVASGAAYKNAPHSDWSANRRYVQFLATPAAADAAFAAMLLIKGTGSDACIELVNWFGPGTIAFAEGEAFLDYCRLLMTTTLHLATTRHFLGHQPESGKFAKASLAEAQALLTQADNDPGRAIDLCATPEGLTVRLVHAYEKHLQELDKETNYAGLV